MENIKKQILAFMDSQQIPLEAIESLSLAFDRICDGEGKGIFQNIIEDYQNDYRISAQLTGDKIKQISEISGVDQKQCNLVVYMGLVEILKKHYINT